MCVASLLLPRCLASAIVLAAVLLGPTLAHGQPMRSTGPITQLTPTPSPQGDSTASPQGDPAGMRGLLSDVERIVDAQEYDQWFVDDHAFDELLPELMPSVCRASPDARQSALHVLNQRRLTAGDPREVYRQAGELTSQAEEALHYERQHEALRRAIALAPDHCPFWVTPALDFPGRQTTRYRVRPSLETGGLAQLRLAEGNAYFGGGGAARILGSYRFGDLLTLLGGVEFGGGAMIRPGSGASEFVINYFPAIPLVLRLHHVAWHYEIETAAVALFQADNTTPSYGIRGGVGLGFSTLRTRSILPWAGFVLSGEHYFPGGGRSAMQFVRAGVRIGFFWDPE